MNGLPPRAPCGVTPKGASAADWRSQIRADLA